MFKQPIYLIVALCINALLSTAITTPASALSEDKILEKLKKIPVFTITNKTGNFLEQSISSGDKKRKVSPVYFELKDAALFLKSLKIRQPEQSKMAQITVVPLSEIYKLQLQAQKKSDSTSFVFFPTEQQLNNARILKQPYQPNAFYPVPIFVVAIKQQDKYATVQENKLTPLFLDRQQAQQWLERVRKKDPQLVAAAEIKVNYLHIILKDFRDRDYPAQQQLVLVPSASSVESIRKLQAQQAKPSTPTAPSNTSVPAVSISNTASPTFVQDVQKILDLIN